MTFLPPKFPNGKQGIVLFVWKRSEVTQSFAVFAHVTAEKHSLYRAILAAFRTARQNFRLHLRWEEVSELTGAPEEEARAALRQLCSWGNLSAQQDTAEVATVSDFYRERFLYALTHEGEAAESALAHFEEQLVQTGELQSAALDDILSLLRELHDVAEDPSKSHRCLRELWARFEELTDRAQVFMGSLQRTIDLYEVQLDAFLAYKDHLLDYLNRFLARLTSLRPAIASQLKSLQVESALRQASQRELVDAVAPTPEDFLRAEKAWLDRWAGLVQWFVDSPGRQCQAEVLRARARSAVPALLNVIGLLNERRSGRSDRLSDLRTMALWFAQTDNDRQAHLLWRAAFGLYPSRHLQVDDATLARRDAQGDNPRQSWLASEPLVLTPRLRETGRYSARGRAKNVVDYSADKALIEQRAQEEARQIAEAARVFCHGRRTRLSELPLLSETEFELFLDLLSEALSVAVGNHGYAETESADGSMILRLEPAADGTAEVRTSRGIFSGPDCWLTVTSLLAQEAS